MTLTEITGIVGSVFGVSTQDIRQKVRRDRSDRVVIARHVAVSLGYKYTKITQTEVAGYFNLIAHATIINSKKKCDNLVETNKIFALLYKRAERSCNLSEFERMQITNFIPFVYSLDTPNE